MIPIDVRINNYYNSRANTLSDGTKVLSRDMVATSVNMCIGQTRENLEPIKNNLSESISTLKSEVRKLKKAYAKASADEKPEIADRIKTKTIHIEEMTMKLRIYKGAIGSINKKPGCRKILANKKMCGDENLAFVDYCWRPGHK